MPTQYRLHNYTTGKNEFRFECQFREDVTNNGVETNNIEYLKEANFCIKNIKINTDL